MLATALALLLASTTLPAAAGDTVYRCGNEYTQRACAGARTIDAADPVTAARVADAVKVAAAERRLGDEMARDRRASEAALRPALAGSLGTVKVAAAASAPTKAKRKTKNRTAAPGDDTFIARVPKTKLAKS